MNRAEARAQIRSRLADPASNGLFSDTLLDTALEAAWGAIASRFQVRTSAAVLVPTEAETVTTTTPGRVVVLRDADGLPLPRLAPDAGTDPALLGWWIASPGSIRLSRPTTTAEAGTWHVEAWEVPTLPGSDATDFTLPESVLPALVAAGAANALRARLADDVKRGRSVPTWARALTRDLEAEAARILAAHARTATGGALGTA